MADKSATKQIWRKIIKFTQSIILFLVILVVIAAVGFYSGIQFEKDIVKVNFDLLPPPEPAPPVITSKVIQQEILQVSEYASLRYHYTNAARFETNTEFYGWIVPLTTKNFIVVYDGNILLGFKSGENGKNIKVQMQNDKIYITLPEIEILSHVIDEKSIEVLDESRNIFNPILVEDYIHFVIDQKAKAEEKARSLGLYQQAREQAQYQIGSFLRALPNIGESGYTLIFLGVDEPIPEEDDVNVIPISNQTLLTPDQDLFQFQRVECSKTGTP